MFILQMFMRNSFIFFYKTLLPWNLCLISLSISNTLFREFSLISMRRVPELPAGPHKLLAILAEPLKQKENLFSLEDQEVSDNLQEFEDWVRLFLHIDVYLTFMPSIFISMYNVSLDQLFALVEQHEYYSLDATYRNWLKVEMQNDAVSPEMLSAEENDQAVAAAKETLELAFLLLKSKFINGCIIWCTSVKICFLCCKISDSICKYLILFSLFLMFLSVAIRG